MEACVAILAAGTKIFGIAADPYDLLLRLGFCKSQQHQPIQGVTVPIPFVIARAPASRSSIEKFYMRNFCYGQNLNTRCLEPLSQTRVIVSSPVCKHTIGRVE